MYTAVKLQVKQRCSDGHKSSLTDSSVKERNGSVVSVYFFSATAEMPVPEVKWSLFRFLTLQSKSGPFF